MASRRLSCWSREESPRNQHNSRSCAGTATSQLMLFPPISSWRWSHKQHQRLCMLACNQQCTTGARVASQPSREGRTHLTVATPTQPRQQQVMNTRHSTRPWRQEPSAATSCRFSSTLYVRRCLCKKPLTSRKFAFGSTSPRTALVALKLCSGRRVSVPSARTARRCLRLDAAETRGRPSTTCSSRTMQMRCAASLTTWRTMATVSCSLPRRVA
mmetsp:Transcript_6626/g.15077  ORF Transcript_6626/g.15077 Transcript_6626/m.15077 type:complete len:214 (+) Transcript_6626:23-664(+)